MGGVKMGVELRVPKGVAEQVLLQGSWWPEEALWG